MGDRIFVQIASYRDPQLLPTLRDCIEKANNPADLRFSIAWQRDDLESLDEFEHDSRFKIIDVPYQETKGTCWARNLLQQEYDGEEYTLQLDSHHRFVEGWDDELISMLKELQSLGYEKPLLTAYAPSFDPDNDPEGRVNEPWEMGFDRFIPEGAIFFLPKTIDDWKDLDTPVPARFYSAHLAFSLGKFAEEVQHDPEYYFHGEEISIAARAYTHGYDLFHPHKVVIWHEYTRRYRVKQWDDDSDWSNKNDRCHLRNRKLFGMDNLPQDVDFGKYGFGKERTLKQYEIYAGINFSMRAIQQHTKDGFRPPNPNPYKSEEEWESSFLKIFKHCLDIGKEQITEDDCDFWCVAFEDKDGKTVHREDVDKEEMKRMAEDPDGYNKVFREFECDEMPTTWVVWPHSESKGWLDRITGEVYTGIS